MRDGARLHVSSFPSESVAGAGVVVGTIAVGCVFIGLNLLSDLFCRVLDPRAR